MKRPYILIIFQENMKVAIFTEHRMRRKSLEKDFMRGHSLLKDSEILTAKRRAHSFQSAWRDCRVELPLSKDYSAVGSLVSSQVSGNCTVGTCVKAELQLPRADQGG